MTKLGPPALVLSRGDMTAYRFVRGAVIVLALVVPLTFSRAQAGTVTLTFDLDVWDQFNYATLTNNSCFQPFSTAMTVTFDGSVTLVEQDANSTLVFFGHPLISSPLSATLPYAPVAGELLPTAAVALGNRNYGATQQWSEFTIVQSEEAEAGTTTWAYDFDLDTGSASYPVIPNLLEDSGAALYHNFSSTKGTARHSFSTSSRNSTTRRLDNPWPGLGTGPRRIS